VGLLATAAAAAEPLSTRPAALEQLLSKVKAQHPNASILRVERERYGETEVYEMKLLGPDGQVLKLAYDTTSLAPIAYRTDGVAGQPRRRQGWRHR
jgi:uncharacterized membrane protein YkoI